MKKIHLQGSRAVLLITVTILLVICNLLFHSCTRNSQSKNSDTQDLLKNETDIFQEEDTILFRLAETMPADHPLADTMNYFANLVEQKSNGKIKIKVYYEEELGTAEEIIEQMKFGGIAMARVNALTLYESIPELGDFMEAQKTEEADLQMKWIQNERNNLLKICQTEKITPLIWYYPDKRCFYSNNRKVESYNDLKGTKVKTMESSIMSDIIKELGAEAVEMGGADIYHTLSNDDIPYAEAAFCDFLSKDYGKYIHYVMLTDSVKFPDVMIINTDSLTSLSPEEKEIIKSCAEETYSYHKNRMDLFTSKWINELKNNDKVSFCEEGVD